MAGFYKKDLDVSGLSRLIPAMSKSPLESLGKSMTQLDTILTNRDKEQYSKKVTEELGQLTSSNDLQKYMMGLDRNRLTDATSKGIDSNLANAISLEGLKQKDRQIELKGLETLTEQQKLAAEQEAERQTGDYVSGVQSLLSIDKDKYGDQLQLALSSLREAYPQADVTKGSDIVESLFKTDTDASKQYVKDYDSLSQVEKMNLQQNYGVNNASEYNQYTQEKFKTPAETKAQKEAEGEFKAALNQNKLLDSEINNITNEKLYQVKDPVKLKEINNIFNSAENAGMKLIDPKDKEKLANVENMAKNFEILMSAESKDVTGIADKIVSEISAITGIGDAEENAKVKSALGETLFNIARSWNGPGVLSKTDIDMAKVGAGNLWLSDKDLAGKVSKAIDTVLTNLKSVENNSSSNGRYFEKRYGGAYETLQIMSDAFKTSKKQVTKKSTQTKDVNEVSQIEVKSMTKEQRKELINRTLKGL